MLIRENRAIKKAMSHSDNNVSVTNGIVSPTNLENDRIYNNKWCNYRFCISMQTSNDSTHNKIPEISNQESHVPFFVVSHSLYKLIISISSIVFYHKHFYVVDIKFKIMKKQDLLNWVLQFLFSSPATIFLHSF